MRLKWLLLLVTSSLRAYDLPYLDLGLDNILSGGPTRPQHGWYVFQYTQYYQTSKFTDACGNLLGSVPSPHVGAWVGITELIYQTERKLFLKGHGGLALSLPYFYSTRLKNNTLDLINNGFGISDLGIGLYLQWDPLMYHGRPLFQHRFEFFVSIPTGQYKKFDIDGIVNNANVINPGNGLYFIDPYWAGVINPGNGLYFIDPYWAGTLYFTEKWAASWYLYYLVCGKNRVTCRKPGNAVHLNYSISYEAYKHLFVAINGYYLQQLSDTTLNGVTIPDTKERVLGLGPGLLYEFPQDFYFFAHLYGEMAARNRTQGLNFVFRFVKNF